jgi:predicted permease
MYRLLLLLLPRHRRLAYGDEMRDVFRAALLASSARGGRWAAMWLWVREVIGLVRFAMTDRFGSGSPLGGGPIARDLQWVWRGIRMRGWRTVFIVALFGVALAANAIVFSAADAFVFRTVPYDHPGQLVVFERPGFSGPTDYTSRDAIIEWRKHTDLFDGIQAHDTAANAYLTRDGITDVASGHRITPGLLELLGVMPSHGRPFIAADAEKGAEGRVILSSRLARQLFGTAEAAIGQTFNTGTDTYTVIGVMPTSFRFPSATEQFWRPMKLEDIAYNTGVRHVARLRAGWPIGAAAEAAQQRLPAVVAALPADSRRSFTSRLKEGPVVLRTMAEFRRHQGASVIFTMLVGAAVCLLLIACANVVSLELASSAHRLRTLAVQTALGASRGSLLRIGLAEGAVLLTASALLAGLICYWGLELLTAQLTVAMREALANPLDLDPRVVGFMMLIATATWLLTTLPSLVSISRLSVVDGLRHDARTMPVTRGATRSRHWLVTTQAALTVILLVGSVLFVRTYIERIGREKGLDARTVGTISVSLAPDGGTKTAELEREVAARIRAVPGVVSLARTWSLPPSTQGGGAGPLTIAGRDGDLGSVMISNYGVDPEYFATMGISLVQGRFFDATTPNEAAVIDYRFAQKYWPDGSALGARFGIGGIGFGGGVSEFLVVGVSRELRTDRQALPSGDDVFVSYLRLSPTAVPMQFVVKLDDERRLPLVAEAVRSVAPRLVVRTDTVEARYRRLEGDTRLAAAITSGFGALAWVVAAGGIYAVMAFLVSGRTREIGIRMALGADTHAVRRMVLGASLRSVLIGVALGLGVSALVFKGISSQFLDVTPTDPLTYGLVSGLVIVTAVTATWFPARRAAGVDPAITLRAD